MRSNVKVLSIAALAAVGASVAHAQATGFGQGYVSASFGTSGFGIVLSSTTGTYQSLFDLSSVGTDWATSDFWDGSGTTPVNPVFVNGVGSSSSTPQVGGAGVLVANVAIDVLTFTNMSSATENLLISADTFGFGSGTAQTWNDVGFGFGEGEIYDTAELFTQYSIGYGQSAGMGLGGDYAYFENYDIINGLVTGTFNGGNIFPGMAAGEAANNVTYAVPIAPGASDSIVMVSEYEHESYSITPGPAAVAPFALGLIGVLRRRKRT